MEIHSELLCNWLREVATKTYESTDLQRFPITLRSPFRELFFHRAEIQALAEDESKDPQLRKAAQALTEFVHQPKGLLSSIIEDHTRFSKEGKVLSDILWTIYPPNSLLVLNSGPIKECWICRDVRQYSGSLGGEMWVIEGLRIGYDGRSPGLAKQEFLVDNPSTTLRLLNISDLSLIPVPECEDWEELKRVLLRRSESLVSDLGTDLASFVCRAYMGAVWDYPYYAFRKGTSPVSEARSVDERVMVDFMTHSRAVTSDYKDRMEDIPYNAGKFTARGVIPWRKFNSSAFDAEVESVRAGPQDLVSKLSYEAIANTANALPLVDTTDVYRRGVLENLADFCVSNFHIAREEFDLLFPALIPAFGLRSKTWGWILSDRLLEIEWDKSAFDSLQQDERTKRLLATLLKGRKSKVATSEDRGMVAEKAPDGLVFLLQGYVQPE